MAYAAFISYSHAADSRLAPVLQAALHQFAKPFYRLRSVHIFRDGTSLATTPELWPEIQRALSASRYFILLASPDAAQSEWVQKEIEEWFALGRRPETVLIVLTRGDIRWDGRAGDFDREGTTALPAALFGRYRHEPLYLDLRAVRGGSDLSLRHPDFFNAVASLSSHLVGKPKDDLIGEDVAQHRKFRKAALWVVALLLALVLGMGILAWTAFDLAAAARSGELAAEARVALADNDDETAAERALEGVRTSATAEAVQVLRRTIVAPSIVAVLGGHEGDSLGGVAFSPDGSHIVTKDRDSYRIWRNGSFGLVKTIEGGTSLDSHSFSRDGALLATFTDSVRVWSTRTWKQFAVTPNLGRVSGIASIDPTHRYLVTASRFDSTTFLWSLPSGELVRSFTAYPTTEAMVADSGRSVVTADLDGPPRPSLRGRVRVWDPRTGKQRFSRPAVVTGVERNGLSLGPDGVLIATRALDSAVVEVWSARTGATIQKIRGSQWFTSAAFSPRTPHIVTTDETSTVRVWNALSGRQEAAFTGTLGPLHRASFSPDGTRVVAEGDEGRSFVWDVATGRMLGTVFRRDWRSDLDMSPDASFFVVPRGRGARIVRPSGRVDPGGAVERDSGVVVLRASSDKAPSSTRWSPDGRYLAAIGGQSVHVWETRSGRLVGRLQGHTAPVLTVRFNPRNPAQLVTSAGDSTVRTWLVSGRELWKLRGANDTVYTGAEYSPDGRRVVAGARAWDASTGRPVDGEAFARGLEAGADDRMLLVRTHSHATLLRSGSREAVARIQVRSKIQHASFSPDGQRLALACEDNTVRIYGRALIAPLDELLTHATAMLGDPKTVYRVQEGSRLPYLR